MNRTVPPRIAPWLLEHFISGNRNEALAGDLEESFHAGSSCAWYWRQALTAIAIRFKEDLLRRWNLLILASAWALLAPGWQVILIRFDERDYFGHLWSLPWPWSTICVMCLSAAEQLVFIWAPMLAYVLEQGLIAGSVNLKGLFRGSCISALVYLGISASQIAFWMLTSPQPNPKPIDWHALTIRGEILNFAFWGVVWRLPYFITAACALWCVAAKPRRPFVSAR